MGKAGGGRYVLEWGVSDHNSTVDSKWRNNYCEMYSLRMHRVRVGASDNGNHDMVAI